MAGILFYVIPEVIQTVNKAQHHEITEQQELNWEIIFKSCKNSTKNVRIVFT